MEVVAVAEMGLVESAVAFATKAHEGAFRKGPGDVPYISHPLAVKAILESAGIVSPVILAAAVLHDVMEDCGVPYDLLVSKFGKAVASVVAEVTDDPALDKNAKKAAQEAKAPLMSYAAKLVKMADKTSNVSDLVNNPPGWKLESYRGYVASAKRIVYAMGSVHEGLEDEFLLACRRADSAY